MTAARLALRSLGWTILLPGVIAGYLPWRYVGLSHAQVHWSDALALFGLACAAAGVILLTVCIMEFARSGRGTLSPVDPPRYLVVRGLYRYVRNPMYLAVTLILLGEAALLHSADLVAYWACFLVAANLFVIGYEEPSLRSRFGVSYERYTRQVGRWIPRIHSVDSGTGRD
jgi:protein-S-isoprenylcysteine O-methyltransferase Ste14